MYTKTAILVVLLSILSPWLYDRAQLVALLARNAPKTMPTYSKFHQHEIKFADKIRNCEDGLIHEEGGFAILSCDPGRDKWNTVMGTFYAQDVPSGSLYLYDYSSTSASPQKIEFIGFDREFHPLGIEYVAATFTLYAVNHASTGSTIEIFTLDPAAGTATHFSTISHPLIHTPNAISALSPTELYITNDHYFLARNALWLAKSETYIAPPGGSVVYVNLPTNTVKVVARVAFANGVAVLNDTALAVASTTRPAVYIYTIEADRSLTLQKKIKVPALVDNLSVDGNGKLLMAGHPFAATLEVMSKSRVLCNSKDGKDAEVCKTRAGSWVAEWSEEAGLRNLYMDDEFQTSCTAMRDAKSGIGIVTGLYGKGILVWKGD